MPKKILIALPLLLFLFLPSYTHAQSPLVTVDSVSISEDLIRSDGQTPYTITMTAETYQGLGSGHIFINSDSPYGAGTTRGNLCFNGSAQMGVNNCYDEYASSSSVSPQSVPCDDEAGIYKGPTGTLYGIGNDYLTLTGCSVNQVPGAPSTYTISFRVVFNTNFTSPINNTLRGLVSDYRGNLGVSAQPTAFSLSNPSYRPDLYFYFYQAPPATIPPGTSTLTYQYRVLNYGNSGAYDTMMGATIPTGATFLPAQSERCHETTSGREEICHSYSILPVGQELDDGIIQVSMRVDNASCGAVLNHGVRLISTNPSNLGNYTTNISAATTVVCNPPTGAVSGPSSLTVGQTGIYTATASDADSDLNAAELYAENTPGSNNWTRLAGANCSGGSCSVSSGWQPSSPGTYWIVMNAYDNAGNRCTGNPYGIPGGYSDCGGNSRVQVTVPNRPPTATITGSTQLQVGQAGSFSATASDPDGNLGAALIEAIDPSGSIGTVVRNNNCTGSSCPLSGSYTFSTRGTYLVYAIASDLKGLACSGDPNRTSRYSDCGASSRMQVVVKAPPTGTVSGPTTLGVGQTGTYTVTASDPDSDLSRVEFYAETGPGSGNFGFIDYDTCGGGSCSIAKPFSTNTAGTYWLTMNAYDQAGYRCTGNPYSIPSDYNDCGGSSRMQVTVVGPPSCSYAARTTNVPTGGSTDMGSTSTGAITSYFWQASGGSLSAPFASGTNWTAPGAAGSYTITLTVSGPGGSSSCSAPFTANAAPTATNATINNTTVKADGSTRYTVIATGTDPNGGADIGTLLTLINYQGSNAGSYRGYVGWSTQNFGRAGWNGSYKPPGSINCSGGGIGAIYNPAFGPEYINLHDCSTSVAGNTRTATFTVSFNTNFTTPIINNTLSAWVNDSLDQYDGWREFGTFNLYVPPPPPVCDFQGPTTLGINQVGTYTANTANIDSWTWSANGGSPRSGFASTFYWSSNTSGAYTISLTVSGPGGGPASCSAQILVNSPPTVTNATISPANIRPDGSTAYTITVTGTDSDGGDTINNMLAIINYQGPWSSDPANYRGYIGWTSESPYFSRPGWGTNFSNLPGTCSGGGIAGEYNGYGPSYINLLSCSTATSGNTRTATFTVSFNTNFTTPTTNNTISGWVSDAAGATDGWRPFGTFDLQIYSVSGTVYLDVDNSGTLNASDTPFTTSATVSLSGGQTANSAANGTYVISGLGPGTYTSTIPVPSAYRAVVNPPAFTISNASVAGNNFLVQGYTVSGHIFIDANRNGIKDSNEQDYQNTAAISISPPAGSLITGPGTYQINALANDTSYTVSYTPPNSAESTYPRPAQYIITVGPTCSFTPNRNTAGVALNATCY